MTAIPVVAIVLAVVTIYQPPVLPVMAVLQLVMDAAMLPPAETVIMSLVMLPLEPVMTSVMLRLDAVMLALMPVAPAVAIGSSWRCQPDQDC